MKVNTQLVPGMPRPPLATRITGSRRALLVAVVVGAVAVGAPSAARGKQPPRAPGVQQLATFAAPGCVGNCGSGSTVGPDGALYVTDSKAGRVLRVDRGNGTITTFARGLPPSVDAVGVGGAMDVAFIGHTAYVVVTLVGPLFGPSPVINGLYRIDKDGRAAPIADIGAWSIEHPPHPAFFLPRGVQYALQAFRGGFLVTDGHHNRVLQVTRDGDISELIAFGNDVPTGLEVAGDTVLLAQAGPIPHLPQTGKVVAFRPGSPTATTVAAGIRLAVDTEYGADHRLYALSQGIWDLPATSENEGKPASANTGALMRVEREGTVSTVAGPLDRPTSLEIVGDTAYVITLTGKVIEIDGVSE